MKVRGILRTYAEDNRLFEQYVPVKLDRTRRYLITTIEGVRSMFMLPLVFNPEKPILYAITDPLPLDQDYIHNELSNPRRRYLAVTIS